MAKLIDEKAIGVEVSWSFGDGDAEAVTLDRWDTKQLFIDSGFGDYIEDITPSEALVRAARLAPRVRSISVKEFKRPNKDTPRSFGIYYVTTEVGEGGDRFICGARVRIENGRAKCLPPDGTHETLECMQIGEKMEKVANKLLDYVINADISNALLAIGHRKLFWIGRRKNHGGVYYINNYEAAERFVGLLKSLAAKTATNNRDRQFIPQITEMYPRPLTMQTMEGAAEDEFQSKIDKLIDDLNSMQVDGKMRDSTIVKRSDECDYLIAQAKKYKLFLKEKVDIISAKLIEIQTNFRKGLDKSLAATKDAFNDIDAIPMPDKPKENRTFKTKPFKTKKKSKKQKRGRRIVTNIDDLFDV